MMADDGYDLEPDETPSGPAPEGEDVPAPEDPKARIDAAPLLETREDGCPGCGRSLAPEVIVCTECGYDLRSNDRLASEACVDIVGGDVPDGFTAPGRGSVRVLLAVGGAIAIVAMVAAGVFASRAPEASLSEIVLSVFRAGYDVVLHTGTGLVAVFASARILGLPVGRLDLAVARVLVVFAVFELVSVAVAPVSVGGVAIGRWVYVPAAIGSYFLAAWLLFGRARAETLLLTLAHTVLWAFVKLGESVSQAGGS